MYAALYGKNTMTLISKALRRNSKAFVLIIGKKQQIYTYKVLITHIKT
jgi:hypothetical protein